MKKVFFILIALFSISTIEADVIIATEFDGIVLGKSSRTEIQEILTSKGLILSSEQTEVDEYGCSNVYKGVYIYEDMDFNEVYTRFVEDTIVSIVFKGYCDTACTEYGKSFVERIHVRYNELACADSSLLVLSATNDAEGFKTWSRKDDESIVLTMQSDSACFCAYFAKSKIFEMSMKQAFDKIKHLLPDYAEENKVYGVAGVKFGDSKQAVKSVILYKSESLVDEDAHSIIFAKTRIGGATYDYATFYFSANQLVSVNLQDAFYSWRKEEALMQFENVKSQYERKYSNLTELKDEEDLKGYNCGAYIDGYDYKPILISFQKSLSKGGDIMYYVQVDYYNHRTDNLYDDEI